MEGQIDQSTIAERRKLARQLLAKAMSTAPLQSPWQGVANMANAAFAGWEEGKLDKAERDARSANETAFKDLASVMAGTSAAPASSPAAPSTAATPADTFTAPAALLPRFAQAEAQYGLPPNFLAQTAKVESNFDPNAANPRSSARGLFQFTKGTARDYGLANPMDPIASTDAAARLAADNSKTLSRALGRAPSGGELYLAHQQGGGGASALLANPNARAVDIVGRKAVLNNGGHEGMTAGEFARKWTQKVAQNEADLPAAGAAVAEAPGAAPGFNIPSGDAGLPIMQPGGALPNFDQETGRWNGPSNPPALAAVPQAPQPDPAPTPKMDQATFDAIASNNAPLDPAFQAEGVSQPWMGTALKGASPAVAQIAQAIAQTQPPVRPADLPAPGATEAIGQLPPSNPLANTADPTKDNAGVLSGLVASEELRKGQPSGAGVSSPFAAIAAAMSGQPVQASPASAAPPQSAPAAPTPTVAAPASPVATDTPPAATPAAANGQPTDGQRRVASAMTLLNSPYATAGQKLVAKAIVDQAFKDPTETRLKQLQVAEAERKAADAPLDRQGRELDVKSKQKAYDENKAPTTKVVKQADGSEVALQWDAATSKWIPLEAPQGGNAVGGTAGNPYALPGKPTESMSKDAGFASRMVESHNLINGLESVGTDKVEAAKGSVPYVGNAISSPEKQKFEQAKRNFVTAVLRKESGAVIGPNEFVTEEKKYFPQVGDTPEVIKQKRDARELAIEGVMAGAGSGYKVPESYKPQRGKPSLPSGQTKSGVKWSVE